MATPAPTAQGLDQATDDRGDPGGGAGQRRDVGDVRLDRPEGDVAEPGCRVVRTCLGRRNAGPAGNECPERGPASSPSDRARHANGVTRLPCEKLAANWPGVGERCPHGAPSGPEQPSTTPATEHARCSGSLCGCCSGQQNRNDKVARHIRATTGTHRWARPVSGGHWPTELDAQRLPAQPSACDLIAIARQGLGFESPTSTTTFPQVTARWVSLLSGRAPTW
jgi:hypothetical protein